MPVPTPTAEQQVIVREIILTETLAQTVALINTLTDAEWTRTLDDIDEWEAGVKNDYTHITGNVTINPDDPRLALINRVRRRLGLSLLALNASGQIVITYSTNTLNAACGTLASLQWF